MERPARQRRIDVCVKGCCSEREGFLSCNCEVCSVTEVCTACLEADIYRGLKDKPYFEQLYIQGIKGAKGLPGQRTKGS